MANSDDSDVISTRVPPQVADRVEDYQEAIGESRSGTVRYLIREGLDADRRVEAVQQDERERARERVKAVRQDERERARERVEAVRQDERERARERVESVRRAERERIRKRAVALTPALAAIGVALTALDPVVVDVIGYSFGPIQIAGIGLVATMILTIIVDTRS
jgi:Flp pilus assembly protein TadB